MFYDTIKKGKRPLTIGGDHSITIGTLSGALEYYGDTLSTVWIDAHADINTMEIFNIWQFTWYAIGICEWFTRKYFKYSK